MKLLVLLGATLLIAASAEAAAKTSTFDEATFDAKAAAVQTAGVTGVIAVTDARRTLYRRASSPEADAKLWPWGSLSKQVAAALAMRLIDKGKLSLDTTIAQALPDFPNSRTGMTTVRQLLQHNAGLPNPDDTPPGAAGVPGFYLRSGAMAGSRDDAVAFCGARTDAAPPGYRYNNCDTIVLGAMLGAAAGRQFTTLIADEIVKPARLSTLRLAAPNEHPVAAYGTKAVPRVNLVTLGAGGALVGSLDDVLAFNRALMTGRIVSDAGTVTMWTGDPALNQMALGAFAYETPLPGCDAPVRLVERRGAVDGVQMRNIIAPDLEIALTLFTDNADADLGDIAAATGASFDLTAAAFCSKAPE